MSAAISLPKEPVGDHFEHFTAALLHAAGCFVEKNITEKVAKRELQELDVVGSRWLDSGQLRILAEAKSGTWGVGTLFELLGKKQYLGLDRAVLFHKLPMDDQKQYEAVHDRFGQHSVWPEHVGPNTTKEDELLRVLSELCGQAEGSIKETLNKTHCLSAWRYSFWLEKVLISKLVSYAKGMKGRAEVMGEALRLFAAINDRFFLPDCRDASLSLYSSYGESSDLTRRAITEKLDESPGDELRGLSADRAFGRCVYEGAVPAVQACMYLEHRSRCLILKAATDMIMHKRHGTLADAKIFGIFPKDAALPRSFKAFVASHSNSDAVDRYPQLWQNFIFGWGGFLLTDRLSQEYELLAVEAGLTPGQVERGLSAFDALFPTSKGWFYQHPSSKIKLVKLVPSAFRGLGMQRRSWVCGHDSNRKFPPFDSTNLANWSQCGYALLDADVHRQ